MGTKPLPNTAHHTIIVELIAKHFSRNGIARVRDARQFKSSETGYPRRIKDLEKRYRIHVTRTRKPVTGVDGVYETEYSVDKESRNKLRLLLGKAKQKK